MVYTDFTKYSHAQLRTMAQALDPGAVMAAGDPWRKAADTLKQIRQTLTKASTEAATSWEGTTSDAFHTRMLTLAASINNAAAYANDAANILHNASEAMAKAKRDMPEEPGNWDKVKDTVGDALFGDDDEHIPLADRKKAEAAAIMQTLAMHYRIATPALKPPPPYDPKRPPVNPGGRDDFTDQTASDQSAFVAAGGVMTGMGAGNLRAVGGPFEKSAEAPPVPRNRSGSSGGVAPKRSAVSGSTPISSEPGIKGGTAKAPTKPEGASYGAGTGVDGVTAVAKPTAAGPQPGGVAGTPTPAAAGPQTGTGPTWIGPGKGETVRGPFTGGRENQTLVERGTTSWNDQGGRLGDARGGAARGAAGIHGGSPGQFGPGAGRTGGTVVGDSGRAASGGKAPSGEAAPGSKRAFTEGGSGLGQRNRLRTESAIPSGASAGSAVPFGGAHGRAKEKEKARSRPDYLVEDEETWESGKPANSNVVK
ncbi:WXG100 family type VII secretion target [Kitasatospora sp. NPDC048298]|uniref:WXG100 family type VII secretion target n=1 Tax=Kitasatospora sp. NPDC048298 TaxID=3364049 RepID=UPI003714FBA9